MPTATPEASAKAKAPRGKYAEMEVCQRNGMQLVMQGLHTIVRVAQSEDLKYALPAGQWLVSYGDGLIREQQAKAAAGRTAPQAALPAPQDRDGIIKELQGLYAKALGQSSLILEAETEEPPAPAK